MNFQNSKTCDSYRLLLNLSGDLKNSDNHVVLSNVSIYYEWENIKIHIITIDLKQLQRATKILKY